MPSVGCEFSYFQASFMIELDTILLIRNAK